MPATEQDLYTRLDALGLGWTTTEHPPLHTVAESKALRGELPGGHVKNLFLRDKNKKVWLIVAEEDRPVDLKTFRKRIGARGSLSFGNPELLMEVLGVAPGAVSPFGLINDADCRATVILDEGLMAHRLVNVHPLRNDATTTIASADLVTFIRDCGHDPQIMDLEAAAE
ncbi:MAG: prolyl-tRNA synthetase associated domain-containing protein [Rhodospirillaceae bacterium]|nr:prolyl-tRNA synthetase associated domain-containing protein [Rhodospirillaceae bacterium]MYB14217.1 prolyl-tRNA synthetase associated domain-containing protein [Rhodospirillaceae bacterium]MYI49238.1 prolyl-tRNA synthetase associated domain-containing protein [Rhodospirillaceae bacterium]